MSRIGKKPIKLAEKVEVNWNAPVLSFKGPLGSLTKNIPECITIEVQDGEMIVRSTKDDMEASTLWGTYSSHIKNMIEGVSKGFVKKLIIEGIGYKCEVKGDELVFGLGFSHPVKVSVPAGLKVTSEKGVLTITGVDKDLVGQFSAMIRDLKKPEPYKGKGIRYEGEYIRRKQGKKSV